MPYSTCASAGSLTSIKWLNNSTTANFTPPDGWKLKEEPMKTPVGMVDRRHGEHHQQEGRWKSHHGMANLRQKW